MIRTTAILFLSLFSWASFASNRSITYFGYVLLPKNNLKIPARLELIRDGYHEGAASDLVAFLKLSYGGFDSHEYATQIYRQKDFDWNAFDLVLDANVAGNGPDLTIFDVVTTNEKKVLSGRVRSFLGETSQVGSIELIRYDNLDIFKEVSEIFPDHQVHPPLTGVYWETDGKQFIEIEAMRTEPYLVNSQIPFEGLSIIARTYFQSLTFVSGRSGSFDNVVYNFYKNRLFLNFSEIPNLSSYGKVCSILFDGIRCGDGVFKRVQHGTTSIDQILAPRMIESLYDDQHFEKVLVPQKEIPSPKIDVLRSENFEDTFYGYLYSERNKVYKKVLIQASRSRIIGNDTSPKIRYSMTVRLHLGEQDDEGLVSFKFHPSERGENCSLVFLESDSDPQIALTHWTDSIISGVWYSRTYGRVGSFYVSSLGIPVFRDGVEFERARLFDGEYKGDLFKFPITLSLQSTPQTPNKMRPYYPISIQATEAFWYPVQSEGNAVLKEHSSRITRVEIDPFVGVIALFRPNKTFFFGKTTSEGIWLTHAYHNPSYETGQVTMKHKAALFKLQQ